MMSRYLFKNLLQEHKNRVFNYALYFLRNREDAEDVTQEVFIKLWKNMNQIDRKKMKAWMMQVAHNCCVDHIRRRKGVNQKHQSAIPVDFLPSKGDVDSNPESVIERKENRNLLLSAMETLPDRTKSMLLLHYYQGFKYETIGSILNTDVGTVKVAVHRGRKVLREKLAHHFAKTMESFSHE